MTTARQFKSYLYSGFIFTLCWFAPGCADRPGTDAPKFVPAPAQNVSGQTDDQAALTKDPKRIATH